MRQNLKGAGIQCPAGPGFAAEPSFPSRCTPTVGVPIPPVGTDPLAGGGLLDPVVGEGCGSRLVQRPRVSVDRYKKPASPSSGDWSPSARAAGGPVPKPSSGVFVRRRSSPSALAAEHEREQNRALRVGGSSLGLHGAMALVLGPNEA